MAKKRRRRGLSVGTLFMLALTVLVIVSCAVFLFAIAGESLYEKTESFIRSLHEQGLFVKDEAEQTKQLSEGYSYWTMEEYTPVPYTAAPPTPTPVPAQRTLNIAAAGTIYAPKAIRQSAQEGKRFDFQPVFKGLGDTLLDADLALATLETTTAGERAGYGNFNVPAEILDALRTQGVDLLSLSTERALDYGYDGLDLTIGELTSRGIAYAGIGHNGANRATMMRVNGVQVAVLAYTYGLSEEGEAKSGGDSRAVIAQLNVQQMTEDIRQARISGANLVIVMPHWGTKNKSETPDTVRRMARTLAEAGADVILGTHPNVPQEAERLRVTRADGLEYDVVVCYSLGSLLTDARTEENTAGMIAHLGVKYDPVTRRTTLGNLYCTPVYIARQREENRTVYRVIDAENSAALSKLDEENQQAAKRAVEQVRDAVNIEEGQG